MKFTVEPYAFSHTAAECTVLFVSSGSDRGFHFLEKGRELDTHMSGFLSGYAEKNDFDAKRGSIFTIHSHSENVSADYILVGIGSLADFAVSDWLMVVAKSGREAKKMHTKNLSIFLEKDIFEKIHPQKISRGIVEGMTLGTYTFNRYKKMKKKEHDIELITVLSDTNEKELREGIGIGEWTSKGTVLARDLVNEPSAVTTPTFLSLLAQDIAKKSPSITCDVLEKKDMEKLGMGGILGIAKGSDEDPKLITLSYKGDGKKTIMLVGKGVTFDSGGLSLKSQDGMETMKLDMAGAASVLGIFSVIDKLRPHCSVIGLIPAVENMPSGRAIKPGDVVRAYNGKTIEIISTDAEGRVILADALSYGEKHKKPDAMIDLATLTGACMIALGEDIAGVFANQKDLGKQLMESSRQTGEAIWELPLAESYTDLLKSDVADVRNVSKKRYGGAITAALFLKEFVDTTPWAHIDIAGPAFAEKDSPLTPVGGTGFGVRLILEYLTLLPQ
jgi:leucyl aminopeptidase